MRRLILACAFLLLVPACAQAAPTASFTFSPSPARQGSPVTFTSTSACDRSPCSFLWTDPTDGQVFSKAASFSFTYQGTGSRSVRLRVTNSRGSSSTVTRSFTVVAASPTPTPTPSPTATPTPTSTPTPTPTATPSPTVTPTPTPDPTQTNNCMPDPSSCGFPDVETTGPDPLIPRTTVNGGVTLTTAGQVYADKTVNGSITVEANNVTIRNVKVNGGQIFIHWGSTYTGLVVQNTEIDLGGDIDSRGILYGNYTAEHVFIHNGSDCAQLDFNVTIRDSLCVVGPDANGDAWPDNNTFCNDPRELHFDGFESDGGSNYTLDHNTIRNPCDQVSAILMSTNVGAIRDVKVTNNLMAGGGYTLYCNVGSDTPNETVTGNRFSKAFWPTVGYWGPMTGCGLADTFSGNVRDEDGSTLQAG